LLHKDPELREKLRLSGFEKVREHYSVAIMADRALQVYESMLRDAPKTAKQMAAEERG
jgi:glycosyltransferase involved in cell wall biosynthesis